MNMAVIVRNQQATMTNKSKYRKEPLRVFYFSCINKKKYWKWKTKTFILPHKREYGLVPVFACSRNCWHCERKTFILPHKRVYGLQPHLEHSRRLNCWKSHKPKWRMRQNIAKNIWQFLIWTELTKKNIENERLKLSFCHTSENTV